MNLHLLLLSRKDGSKGAAKRIQHLVNYPDVAVQLISQFPDDVKNSMKIL